MHCRLQDSGYRRPRVSHFNGHCFVNYRVSRWTHPPSQGVTVRHSATVQCVFIIYTVRQGLASKTRALQCPNPCLQPRSGPHILSPHSRATFPASFPSPFAASQAACSSCTGPILSGWRHRDMPTQGASSVPRVPEKVREQLRREGRRLEVHWCHERNQLLLKAGNAASAAKQSMFSK